jgi:outer membrane protein, heavy metal efflux system
MLLAMVLAAAPLSLAEVLDSADAAFPSLVGARADVDAAEGEAVAAAGAFDPSWKTRGVTVPVGGYPQTRLDSVIEVPTPLWGATVFGGYRLGLGKIQDYYGERTTWSAGEVRAGVSVPLLRNGPTDRRRTSIQRAELGRHVAGLSVEQQRIEVGRLAAFRYWDWVAAGKRREIAQSLLEIAKARDGQLAGRAKAGEVAQFDRQDNQRALVQREGLMVQAQRGVEQAAFELSLYVRDDQQRPTVLVDERLPAGLPDADPALEPRIELDQALARRPDVQRLADQKQQQLAEVRLLDNQLLPSLDLGVAFSQDFGRSPSPAFDALGKPELEVSLSLDVPLLFRAPLGRLRAGKAAVSKLDAQLQLARERVELEVRDASSALQAARQRVALTRQEIEVAAKLEQGERTRFELGDSTLLFVNLREQATAEARLREVDALVDFHKALASLKAALAVR